MEKVKEQLSMPRCDIEELKGQIEQLKEENQQLKELLISAKDIIEWYSTESGYIDLPTNDLLTKIDEVLK